MLLKLDCMLDSMATMLWRPGRAAASMTRTVWSCNTDSGGGNFCTGKADKETME